MVISNVLIISLKTNTMKTAEEILKKNTVNRDVIVAHGGEILILRTDAIAAMEEYADQYRGSHKAKSDSSNQFSDKDLIEARNQFPK